MDTNKNVKVILRSEHGIARDMIDRNALRVIRYLKQAGFEAYLVGGCVRDLILGHIPKDFDVVTSARPNQIKNVFGRQCRLIGRRFRLAHVYCRRGMYIEVATFRADHEEATDEHEAHVRDGLIVRDNVYGSIDQDAVRRDFTLNALYYDPDTEQIIDFFSGFSDLQQRLLRIIGDPVLRYQEDPVRMLRAVRFMAKFGLTPIQETKQCIFDMRGLILKISNARLFDEMLKLFQTGIAAQVYPMLKDYGFIKLLFPLVDDCVNDSDFSVECLLQHVFASTDCRVQQGKSVMSAFLFAGLLWFPFLKRWRVLQNLGRTTAATISLDLHTIIIDLLQEQSKTIAISWRIKTAIKSIWQIQLRLERAKSSQAYAMIKQNLFRASYDLLALRAKCCERLQSVADFWQEIQDETGNDVARHKKK